MDRKERVDDLFVAVKAATEGVLPSIWTAMPGILKSVDLAAGTCEVQPAIQAKVYDKTGKGEFKNMPLCVDVPVLFLGGGGFSITFPMSEGDEGLVVFACRCIDAWWQQGGVQPQAEMRMHDLSDGFFIPGFRSQARKLADVSADSAQLRSDDGTMRIDMNLATGIMTLKAAQQIVLDTLVTHIKGGLVIDGSVSQLIGGGGTVNFGNATITTTGNIIQNGKDIGSLHTHGGVLVGGANSGPVT